MFTITAIDHAGLRVTDRRASLAFLAKLGFRLEAEEESPEHHATGVINAAGARLNLIHNAQPLPDARNVLLDVDDKWPGWTHLAFVVDDLDALMTLFAKEGIAITEGPLVFGNGRRRVCFIRDADRNVFEFNELAAPKPAKPIVLYGMRLSGHSHRAQLMLSLLDLPCRYVDVDLRAGEHRQPAFRSLNAFATVPVIDDGGAIIADSVAILVYLATRYDPARTWLPIDPLHAAEVQRWLSVAQGPLFRGPNSARLAHVFKRPIDQTLATEVSLNLLQVMNAHLADRDYLAAKQPTIADVANYSYVARAPEGGIDLRPFPHVLAWLQRIESLQRFVAMPIAVPAGEKP